MDFHIYINNKQTLSVITLIQSKILIKKKIRMSKLPNINTSIFYCDVKNGSRTQCYKFITRFPDFPVDERLTNIIARLQIRMYQYTNGWLPSASGESCSINKILTGRIISLLKQSSLPRGNSRYFFATIQALVEQDERL
jgi:methionine aminotransferase